MFGPDYAQKVVIELSYFNPGSIWAGQTFAVWAFSQYHCDLTRQMHPTANRVGCFGALDD
jgi:hypothetical protein